jgi:surfactin synthase thioesterase subunit
MATVHPTSWLRVLASPASVGRTLVCFPPGGASASAYRDWPGEFGKTPGGKNLAVLGVRYPGRQDRFGDALVTDIEAMADLIAAELRQQVAGPVALFGHSMGAMVAFEVARRLPAKVTTLFVSGRPDPSFEDTGTLHQATDAELIDQLAALANDPASVQPLRTSPEVAELVLPAVRGDYLAVETYRLRPGAPLSCDIVALVSADDPTTTVAGAQGWCRHTTAGFALERFAGGHFYLDEPGARAQVCALVLNPNRGIFSR